MLELFKTCIQSGNQKSKLRFIFSSTAYHHYKILYRKRISEYCHAQPRALYRIAHFIHVLIYSLTLIFDV